MRRLGKLARRMNQQKTWPLMTTFYDAKFAMNETQTVFLVFFAIIWGMVANVQPRWKAFQLPLFFRLAEPTLRVLLSIVFLNVIPIMFFGWILLSLKDYKVDTWTPWTTFQVIVHGVIPAFATFGFYRFWLGIIELNPTLFYREYPQNVPEEYQKAEPSIAELWYPKDESAKPPFAKIEIRTGTQNLVFGLIYVIVAGAGPFLFRCI